MSSSINFNCDFTRISLAAHSHKIKFEQTQPELVDHLELKENEVHLWLYDLESSQQLNFLTLSEDERREAEVLRTRQDISLLLTKKFLVRNILANYLYRDPQRIEFQYQERGKPFIANSEVEFSLSNSERYIILSVGLKKRLGVDIEKFAFNLNWLKVAQKYYSEQEISILTQHKDLIRACNDFIKIWTFKEALFKAQGLGVCVEWKNIDLSKCLQLDFQRFECSSPIAKLKYGLIPIDSIDGFSCALAYEAS